jgi:hypothetical protein
MPRKSVDEREAIFLEERRRDMRDYYAGYLGYDFVEEHEGDIRDFATAMTPYMTVHEAERILRK